MDEGYIPIFAITAGLNIEQTKLVPKYAVTELTSSK